MLRETQYKMNIDNRLGERINRSNCFVNTLYFNEINSKPDLIMIIMQ